MNIPISKALVENVLLKDVFPVKLFIDLKEKEFSGYIYLVIDSEFGFEESIILFLKGDICGSIYYNDYLNIEQFGRNALEFGFNCFGFRNGILNIYELSLDQIKLLLIFNDKIVYNFKIKKKDISKIIFNYNPDKLKKFVDNNINIDNVTKYNLLDKFHLNDILRN
ncbi:MAG: hypothetical protein PHR26_01130 [Candidatus ainarchaeum sp.]|nr:hypothetical protein [Candidatus ainarchaeum sp.]MDD3976005.1 hypothetical protein [Candidatus ainarchaeum sp.]